VTSHAEQYRRSSCTVGVNFVSMFVLLVSTVVSMWIVVLILVLML
jgi:hypothetical protein